MNAGGAQAERFFFFSSSRPDAHHLCTRLLLGIPLSPQPTHSGADARRHLYRGRIHDVAAHHRLLGLAKWRPLSWQEEAGAHAPMPHAPCLSVLALRRGI
jgi:hypothetical protein